MYINRKFKNTNTEGYVQLQARARGQRYFANFEAMLLDQGSVTDVLTPDGARHLSLARPNPYSLPLHSMFLSLSLPQSPRPIPLFNFTNSPSSPVSKSSVLRVESPITPRTPTPMRRHPLQMHHNNRVYWTGQFNCSNVHVFTQHSHRGKFCDSPGSPARKSFVLEFPISDTP
jgi:hypothetical protein